MYTHTYVYMYIYVYIHAYIYIYIYIIMKNALWVFVAVRENISPIILAQTEMTWICTRLQLVIVAKNLTAYEGYESTRHAGSNNEILLPENVNQMMSL